MTNRLDDIILEKYIGILFNEKILRKIKFLTVDLSDHLNTFRPFSNSNGWYDNNFYFYEKE